MKDNEISDKDIETATSYVKLFVQFLLEKQEHIIDYPKDEKGGCKISPVISEIFREKLPHRRQESNQS